MNHYCKLFINSSLERSAVVTAIASIVAGSVERFSIACDVAEVDVRVNEEWDAIRVGKTDGFLFYRFYADVEPIEGAKPEDYIGLVAKIIRELQNRGCTVVPACDFEDRLAILV